MITTKYLVSPAPIYDFWEKKNALSMYLRCLELKRKHRIIRAGRLIKSGRNSDEPRGVMPLIRSVTFQLKLYWTVLIGRVIGLTPSSLSIWRAGNIVSRIVWKFCNREKLL